MSDTDFWAKRANVDSLYNLPRQRILGQVPYETFGPGVFRTYDST